MKEISKKEMIRELHLLQEHLRDIIEKLDGHKIVVEEQLTISVRKIQMATCEEFGISFEQLMSPSRLAHTVRAREYAIYLANEKHPNCKNELTILFNRCIATINIAIDKTHKNRFEYKVANRMSSIRQRLYENTEHTKVG